MSASTVRLATRVAASRKGAAVRKAAALNCGRGYGPTGAKCGTAQGDFSVGELLARIRAAGDAL